MTFAQMKTRLYKSVQRDDYLVANSADVNYGTFINDAVREIENRKSWTTMKQTADVVIASGDQSVDLPERFKSLQNLRPPVHVVLNDPNIGQNILKPVNVTWSEVEYRRLWMMGGMAWDVQTWIERTGLMDCTLNIASIAGTNLTFRVKFYQYSAPLSGDSDESLLEQLYPRMVMMKAKEIAFEAINDFDALNEAVKQFEILFTHASRTDNYADVAGREGRM